MEIINNFSKIVIFSGAGVSTLSGIKDYKSNIPYIYKNKKYNHKYIMSKYIYEMNKPLFFDYYFSMYNSIINKDVNSCHLFAEELFNSNKLLGVITQNIDVLYQKVIPNEYICDIHGNVSEFICLKSKKKLKMTDIHFSKRNIPHCNCHNFVIKPNVVLYGEQFNNELLIKYKDLMNSADCIIVMGTELDITVHREFIKKSKAFKILINKNDIGTTNNLYDYSLHFEENLNFDFKILDDFKNIFY